MMNRIPASRFKPGSQRSGTAISALSPAGVCGVGDMGLAWAADCGEWADRMVATVITNGRRHLQSRIPDPSAGSSCTSAEHPHRKIHIRSTVTALSFQRGLTQNHTRTHLANWALREPLMPIQQRMLREAPKKLRFDFSTTNRSPEIDSP
jgi:hypothetical protein